MTPLEIKKRYFQRFNGRQSVNTHLCGCHYKGTFFSKISVTNRAVIISVAEWYITCHSTLFTDELHVHNAMSYAILSRHIALHYFPNMELKIKIMRQPHINC